MPFINHVRNFAAALQEDQMHYVLPPEVDKKNAPDYIHIDNYATLKLERCRFDGEGRYVRLAEPNIVRRPLRVEPVGNDVHPAVAVESFKVGFWSMIGVAFGAAMMASSVFVAAANPVAAVLLGVFGFIVFGASFIAGSVNITDQTQQRQAAAA